MPVQASQDLEARFAVFLNPIRDLTKNWEVDIAKYLEDYLVQLSEIQITFDGGITVMNFAEAAMLIQGSATVYSKKVEFLWQMVLRMLDLLSSKRSLERAGEEDGATGGTGGGRAHRHPNASSAMEFESADPIPVGKTIDMKNEEEEVERRGEFKFLPGTPLHLVEREGEKCSARIALFLKNLETFGHKNDFRINRSYLTPDGLLCLSLPEEILKKNLSKAGPRGIECPPQGMDESIAGFMLDSPGAWPVQKGSPLKENDYLDSSLPADDGVDHGGGMEDDDDDDAAVPEAPFELVTSEPERRDEGSRAVCAPPSKGKEEGTGKKEERPDVLEPVNGRFGLRRKGAKENIAEMKITNPLRPLDPHIETPAKRPIRAGRLKKPIPCDCHKEPTSKRKFRSKSKGESPTKKEEAGPPLSQLAVASSVESFITRDLAELVQQQNHKGDPLDPRLVRKLVREEAKRNSRKLAAAARSNKEDDKRIRPLPFSEEDEREGEGGEGEDLGEDDPVPDIDFDNISTHMEGLDMPNPHPDPDEGAGLIQTPFGSISSMWGGKAAPLNDSLLYEPSSEYEALVQKWVSDVLSSAQEHVASSDLARRVNRWRKRIAPRLDEEEQRKAFDIHQYGTRILSHFPKTGSEDDDEAVGLPGRHSTVLFADLASGHEPREVSRMFLSCLMLTNTYNVELIQTVEGDLEMDCLQLRLLSRVRHHHELEEYAPTSQHQHYHLSRHFPASRNHALAGNKRRNKRKKMDSSLSSSPSNDEWNTSSSYSSDGGAPHRPAVVNDDGLVDAEERELNGRRPRRDGSDEVSQITKRSDAAAAAALSPKTLKKRKKLKGDKRL